MLKAYIRLRQTLGVLGIALPVMVITFGYFGNNPKGWYYSISATYYTNAGPIFIALMGAVGMFLITYQGYDKLDFYVNLAAGIFALMLVFFPCGATDLQYVGILYIPLKVSSIIHNISASLFFLLLAFNILFLFTKGIGQPTKQKRIRNIVYRVCGIAILLFLLSEAVFFFLPITGPYTMVNEAGILLFFGIAWLVKGEALLKDK